jgi:hypothetical protein
MVGNGDEDDGGGSVMGGAWMSALFRLGETHDDLRLSA